MALLLRSLNQSASLFRQTSCLVARRSVTSAPVRSAMSKGEGMAYEEMQAFWAKNRALNRPLSPTLTTQKYHLTMVLSITNRVTGVALQAGISLGAIALMLSPGKFPEYLHQFNATTGGAALLFLTKFAASAFFAFHLIASTRHLIWDAGHGYSKPMTLKGSYAVVAITLALTLMLMVFKPPMPKAQ